MEPAAIPSAPRTTTPLPEAVAGRLAQADLLRDGEPGARRRALEAYRELRDHLDPSRPADAARYLWVFENEPSRDAVVADLARAAEGAPDRSLRETAALVRGQAAADAGRTAEAEEAFRRLLGDGEGGGGRIERLACLALAKLYASRRRGFEALVMARRALALARKAEHLWDLCVARARVCMALQVLDDGERLAAAVAELDRSLEEVPAERARPLRLLVLGFRIEAALEVDDLDGARRGLEALRAASDGTASAGLDPRLPLYLEAEIELRSGRPKEALALVRRGREAPSRSKPSHIPLAILEARARTDCGDRAGAARVLRGVLLLLDAAPDPDPLGTAGRIRWALEAGRLLQDRCDDAEAARRAFDLASGRVLRRIVEVGRAIEQIPGLSGIEPEDLRALTDYRNRFVREQAEILDRVARSFGDAAPPEGLVHDEGPGREGFFLACAWCRRVRTAEGVWLPVGEFLPDDRKLRISHGICRDCHDRWMERR